MVLPGWLRRREQLRPERCEQTFSSLSAAPQLEHRHPAGAQHEGCELVRLSEATRPQSFQRRDQHLLRKVVRGVHVSHVTQAIEPNPRRHPAEQLVFGVAVASGANSPHYFRVAQFKVHRHSM
jgi:hypothetical protein